MVKKPSLSNHLRDARLSVADVADRAGVSVASVYLWETGKATPRDVNIAALCKVLKLPLRATKEMAVA